MCSKGRDPQYPWSSETASSGCWEQVRGPQSDGNPLALSTLAQLRSQVGGEEGREQRPPLGPAGAGPAQQEVCRA